MSKLRNALLVFWSAAVVTGCGPAPAEPPHEIPRGPRLLSPAAGVRFVQNDPTTGCEPSPSSGYGFRVAFDWEEIDDAVEYRLVYVRTGMIPLIYETVEASEFEKTSCGFVADMNLDGWTWRVGAVMPPAGARRDTLWSETRENSFAPCRLEDGRPCYSQ